jgi:hypothetical protein
MRNIGETICAGVTKPSMPQIMSGRDRQCTVRGDMVADETVEVAAATGLQNDFLRC